MNASHWEISGKRRLVTQGGRIELQLLSKRDFDLTRGATDLLGSLDYDERFGEIKLEITESMIEVSTLAQPTVDGIAADLGGLRDTLRQHCKSITTSGLRWRNAPFHHWPERRICPGDRFNDLYQRYGYLAKQFTVFGPHPCRLHFRRRRHLAHPGAWRLCSGLYRPLGIVAVCGW